MKFLRYCTIILSTLATKALIATNSQEIKKKITVSKEEKAKINAWLKQQKGLNAYGDIATTIYTKNPIDQIGKYRYIIKNHPQRPWANIKVTIPVISDNEKSKIDAWLKKQGLNMYGDTPRIYAAGENPLRQKDGKIISSYELIIKKFPDKPWKKKKKK